MADPVLPESSPGVVEAAPATLAPAPEVVVAEAPAPEAAPAFSPHTETATLLEGIGEAAKPTPEVKAAEIAPPAEAPQPEVKPVEAVAPEAPKPPEAPEAPKAIDPASYQFTFPEGITPNQAALVPFTALLAKHSVPQESAQELLGLHTQAMETYSQALLKAQHDTFAETRRQWATQVAADPQIGGAGHKTAMASIARMRDMFVPAAEMSAFNDMLRITGVGDHPAFLKLLHNAARFFDEPAMPASSGRPPPSLGQKPGRKGLRSLYSSTPASP